MNCVVCGSPRFSALGYLKKCPTCGLVQVAPMPSKKAIAALYREDLEHFDPYIAQIPVHREYFKNILRSVIPDPLRRSVSEASLIGDRYWFSKKTKTDSRLRGNDKKLLDIGCAMGVLLEEAKKAGIHAQGIDISKDAVAYCRKKGLSVYQGTITSFARGRLAKLNSFDVITAFEIIEHERDPLAMMKRVYKLLNKGGLAVATTPNHDSPWRRIMGRWWVGYHHPEHLTFWNPASLTYLMKKAGFKNITVRRDIPRPFPLSFVFTRGADYFSWAGWILKPIGKLLDRFKLKNPINPWSDLIVFAQK